MVILHTFRQMIQKSNQNSLDIADVIISLGKNIKISGIEVSISSLIPRGDRLSEKGKKKLTKSYKKEVLQRILLLYYIRTSIVN